MVLDIIQQYPKTSLIILSALVSFFITLVNYFTLDHDKVRNAKAKQKELRQKIKDTKGNQKKQMELQNEMVMHSLETMKHSLKPMAITIAPVLIFFIWLKGAFAETIIADTWLWYYIITAIIASIIFRKLFKLP